MNERSHIHMLAAQEYMRHNGKLAMQDCVNVAEAAYMLAEYTDGEMQRELDRNEKADRLVSALALLRTDKIQ